MIMYNTIVTSKLGEEIVMSKGIDVFSTLTGFRYITEQIRNIENTDKKFFFGYEESLGYLASDFVRDKDALQSMVILAELTNFYIQQGKTITDVLEEIYQKYGYYKEETISYVFPGIEGITKIQNLMDFFRNTTFDNLKIIRKEDYLLQAVNNEKGKINLPISNVLKYYLEDESWFAIRPSGTEPKLKIYYSVKADSRDKCTEKLNKLKTVLENIINEVK
ncbi:MAG TPA: hypothetical protein GX740_03830 [Acholeplasmataceae bacterium]|nr:hypothetical protein [Acholeplasmataceae bacterium]